MKQITLAALCLFVLALCGCGGGDSGSTSQSGRIVLNVAWPKSTSRVIPSLSNSILITVKNSAGSVVAGPTVLARPNSTWTSPSLLTGDMAVSCVAYPNSDGTGVAQATGTGAVKVLLNQSAPLTITLDTTVTKVVVSPTYLRIPLKNSVPFRADAYDVNGNLVLTSQSKYTWSMPGNAFASISTSGVVVASSVGSTKVTALYTETSRGGIQSNTVDVDVVLNGPNAYWIDGAGAMNVAAVQDTNTFLSPMALITSLNTNSTYYAANRSNTILGATVPAGYSVFQNANLGLPQQVGNIVDGRISDQNANCMMPNGDAAFVLGTRELIEIAIDSLGQPTFGKTFPLTYTPFGLSLSKDGKCMLAVELTKGIHVYEVAVGTDAPYVVREASVIDLPNAGYVAFSPTDSSRAGVSDSLFNAYLLTGLPWSATLGPAVPFGISAAIKTPGGIHPNGHTEAPYLTVTPDGKSLLTTDNVSLYWLIAGVDVGTLGKPKSLNPPTVTFSGHSVPLVGATSFSPSGNYVDIWQTQHTSVNGIVQWTGTDFGAVVSQTDLTSFPMGTAYMSHPPVLVGF